MEIRFGNAFIEVDSDNKDKLQSLITVPNLALLIGIMDQRIAEKGLEIRANVVDGNLGHAQLSEGYLSALEDIVSLLEKDIKDAIHDK